MDVSRWQHRRTGNGEQETVSLWCPDAPLREVAMRSIAAHFTSFPGSGLGMHVPEALLPASPNTIPPCISFTLPNEFLAACSQLDRIELRCIARS